MANYVSTLTGAEVEAALGFALDGTGKAQAETTVLFALVQSKNVTSVTDAGAGRADYAFTSLFLESGSIVSGASVGALAVRIFSGSATTTSSLEVVHAFSNGSLIDSPHSFVRFGDLA